MRQSTGSMAFGRCRSGIHRTVQLRSAVIGHSALLFAGDVERPSGARFFASSRADVPFDRSRLYAVAGYPSVRGRRSFLRALGAGAVALPFYRLLESSAVHAQSVAKPMRYVSITQKVASSMEIARSITRVASQRTVPDAFTWVVMSAARHITP